MTDALNETIAFQKQILDALPAQIAVVDSQGAVLFQSNSWLMSRKTEGPLPSSAPLGAIGASFPCLLPSDTCACLAGLEDVLSGKKPSFRYEYQADTPGNERWYRLMISPLRGKPLNGAILMNLDITEKKLLHKQILRSQRLDTIGTIAGGIAHDLNNIIAPILLSVGLLKDSAPPEIAMCVDAIETSSLRAAALVRQLLGFVRGFEAERQRYDISRIVRDVEKVVRETFDRSLKVEVKISSSLPEVLCDPTQIHQVLLNLCINARDVMQKGGTLHLSAAPAKILEAKDPERGGAITSDYVRIEVEDTGCGIPDDIIDRIFEPFFTTKQARGTGLGLPTCLGIVTGHGGFIDVTSKVGEGSRFSVYLPVAPALSTPSKQSNTEESAARAGTGQLILLVEDEDLLCSTVALALRRNGYRVATAANGIEALQIIKETDEPFHAVITDMMMPGMGGVELIKKISADHPCLPIIATGGLGAEHPEYAKIRKLFIGFLDKPYSTSDLLALLDKTHLT